MAFVCTQSPFFKRLADVLGLPGATTRAHLSLNAGEIVTLHAEILVTEEQLDALRQILEDEQIEVGGTVQLVGELLSRGPQPSPTIGQRLDGVVGRVKNRLRALRDYLS